MKKTALFLTVILCMTLIIAPASADSSAAAYLQEYYGITLPENVSADAFNSALAALGARPVDAAPLTLADAVTGAVRLAGMEELAMTYVNDELPQKAADTLSDFGVSTDEAHAPYLACALDLGLADPSRDPAGPVSADAAADLLYRAAEMAGKGRHYIGRLSDPGILMEVGSMMNAAAIFDSEKLNESGMDIIISGAATGYSLKYAGFDARFYEENTLRYGHSDAGHILQLIGLLKSEGYDALVQIEPKVSVYEYLPEWGEPMPSTPTYTVREVTEGGSFAFALEFELVLEFDTAEQKEAFHSLIETYAKKYDSRVDAEDNVTAKLLAGSWWQPFYYSRTEMENGVYLPLTDRMIVSDDGFYTLRSSGLPEDSEAFMAAAAAYDPDMTVTEQTIWVDPAFYRYITGEDHQ